MLTHYKETIRLGIPLAIGQIGVIIMGFADTMMVGRYSTDALAAASFVNSVFNLITFLLMGYSYGLTPIISALYGRDEHRKAGNTLRHALVCNVGFALALMALLTVGYFFLDRMGQPAELLPLVRPYYVTILISMLFLAAFNAMRQFTDGITDTAVGMWTLLCGNALNIVGNYFLIYGIGPFPELGLLGAGISTAFSRLMMAVILATILLARRKYAPFREGLRQRGLRLAELRHLNKQSLPVGLQMGMESGAFAFSGVMAGWLSALDLATYQVMITLSTLGFMLYYSFGASMSIRIAVFFGQHNWKQVHMAANAGCRLLLCMMVLSSALFFFFSEPLIRIFTTDPAVVALALTLIPPLLLYQMGDAMQICFANALRGTGHVTSVMWIAFVSYIVVNLPVGYVLAFPLHMGSSGLFLAFSSGLFTAATLYFLHFRKVLRKCSAAPQT